jgi:hypothetical protein
MSGTRDYLLRGLNPFFTGDTGEAVVPNLVDVASATHAFEERIPPSAWIGTKKRRARRRTGNKLLWGVCLSSRERIWQATYYRVIEELVILMQPLWLASFLDTVSTQESTTSYMPGILYAICLFALHAARCVMRHQFEIGA